jgi:predicted pyridoxine 5'-phosphate oxidase superfamily flavin-nucleotide-binding protein
MTIVTTVEQLEALYTPAPAAASTVKVAHRMTPEYRRLVEASPPYHVTKTRSDGRSLMQRWRLQGVHYTRAGV